MKERSGCYRSLPRALCFIRPALIGVPQSGRVPLGLRLTRTKHKMKSKPPVHSQNFINTEAKRNTSSTSNSNICPRNVHANDCDTVLESMRSHFAMDATLVQYCGLKVLHNVRASRPRPETLALSSVVESGF